MNDLEILKQIHKELDNTFPPYPAAMIKFYGKLVDNVPLDGLELLIPDSDLLSDEEHALRQLNRWEIIVSDLKHHGTDGYIHHVNMRGKRFSELAKTDKTVAVTEMQDSGKRQTFETGAVRDTAEGKPRPDLISPFAMERLAEWLRLGSLKYSERNWERGLPISRSTASLHRHLMKFQQGCTDEDHIAAILCNAMFIAHTQEMVKRGVLPESLLDMPDYQPPNVHRNGDVALDYEADEDDRWKGIYKNH